MVVLSDSHMLSGDLADLWAVVKLQQVEQEAAMFGGHARTHPDVPSKPQHYTQHAFARRVEPSSESLLPYLGDCVLVQRLLSEHQARLRTAAWAFQQATDCKQGEL
jgi:hypothetical protein